MSLVTPPPASAIGELGRPGESGWSNPHTVTDLLIQGTTTAQIPVEVVASAQQDLDAAIERQALADMPEWADETMSHVLKVLRATAELTMAGTPQKEDPEAQFLYSVRLAAIRARAADIVLGMLNGWTGPAAPEDGGSGCAQGDYFGECTIMIGGTGPNTYHAVAIVVDLGGNDAYHSGDLIIDVSGRDTYHKNSCGAFATCVDLDGDDAYLEGPASGGEVFDFEGNDRYFGTNASPWLSECDGAYKSQLAHSLGIALSTDSVLSLLVDVSGNDLYDAPWGIAAAVEDHASAVLIDLSGDDTYTDWYHTDYFDFRDCAYGGLTECTPEPETRYFCGGFSQGAATGYRAFAALVDARGNDVHTSTHFALGFASVTGAALFEDAAGNDRYALSGEGLGAGTWAGVGVFLDQYGRDQYSIAEPSGMGSSWLGPGPYFCICGVRTGYSAIDEVAKLVPRIWFTPPRALGVGIFADLGGDEDTYVGPTLAANNKVWQPKVSALGFDGGFVSQGYSCEPLGQVCFSAGLFPNVGEAYQIICLEYPFCSASLRTGSIVADVGPYVVSTEIAAAVDTARPTRPYLLEPAFHGGWTGQACAGVQSSAASLGRACVRNALLEAALGILPH